MALLATEEPHNDKTPSHERDASSRIKRQDSADDHEIPAKLGEEKNASELQERGVASHEQGGDDDSGLASPSWVEPIDGSEGIIPLKFMYEGEWPIKNQPVKGAKQYTSSNTGFPKETPFKLSGSRMTSLSTPRSRRSSNYLRISLALKPGLLKVITDGRTVDRIAEHNRLIETFKVRGLAVMKITVRDADVYATGYSNCRLTREVERGMTSAIGTVPALDVEQWIAAHFILARAGQIRGHRYAVDNDLFFHVKDADFVMVLDKAANVIAFQCADAFRKFLTKSVEKKVTESLEIFSSRQPIPFPDMTRHGRHWIDWLVKNSKLGFQGPENEPRLAKSGVYHSGARCRSGDPNGKHGIWLTTYSARRLPENDALNIRLMPKLN
ncbi:hypothetical protein DL767_007419 [Monosporascus sp. MG133]|nr:hypothetical protein DL767_007419 [Monosporascus sp. MG133]